MNISIVIPNYNGQELLKKNLPQVVDVLSSYKKGNVEIIIPDDASRDNSIEVINDIKSKMKKYSIEIIIVENKKNRGFSSNINSGIRASNGEICILLNTDVVPEKDFLEPLLVHFNDETIFGVACMDKSIESGKVVFRGRGLGRWNRGFVIHSRGEVNHSDTFWISGGSSAIRKSLLDKLGGFDEIYNPFYWEDIDLSYRAQKAGYKITFENKSIVTHIHSEGSIKKHYKNSQIKKFAYRNQFIFVWKNITDFHLILSHIVWLPIHLLKALMRFDFLFIQGFLLALSKYPDIMSKRKKQEKMLIKSDKEILNKFEMLKN